MASGARANICTERSAWRLGAAFLFLFLLVGPGARAAAASTGTDAAKPVKKPARPVLAVPWQVSVLTPPTLFSSNGRRHLAYEIEIANLSSDAWTLEKIDVKGEDGADLLTVDSKDIGSVLGHSLGEPPRAQSRTNALSAGEVVLAYVWIDLDTAASPTRLAHRLTGRRDGEQKIFHLDTSARRFAARTGWRSMAPPTPRIIDGRRSRSRGRCTPARDMPSTGCRSARI
jgi:hypothetical protein